MINRQEELKKLESEIRTIRVAVDFSYCSRLAFRKAAKLLTGKNGQIIALHVIDGDFVKRCVQHRLSKEDKIKKNLFIEAKKRFHRFLRQEKMNEICVDAMVCEGVPYMEINRKAMVSPIGPYPRACSGFFRRDVSVEAVFDWHGLFLGIDHEEWAAPISTEPVKQDEVA